MITLVIKLIGWFLAIIVLSKSFKSSGKGVNGHVFFYLLGSFGLPAAFPFPNEYDILKNDGLIILLLVGLL